MRNQIIGILFILFFSTSVYAGTDLTQISKSTVYLQMDKILTQFEEAKRASQRSLSFDRLAELQEKTKEVFRHAWQTITGKKEQTISAMVFCSSQTIE